MRAALLILLLCGTAQAQWHSPPHPSSHEWEEGGPILILREWAEKGDAARVVDGNQRARKVSSPARADLEKRRRAIEEIHSEPIIEPRWLPRYVADVPAYRVVEGPRADQEGFLQRAWRVPLSPALGTLGGMWDLGAQWSKVVGNGGDSFGTVGGAVAGGLFGLFAGALVGLAGTVVNAVMAVVDLGKGKL